MVYWQALPSVCHCSSRFTCAASKNPVLTSIRPPPKSSSGKTLPPSPFCVDRLPWHSDRHHGQTTPQQPTHRWAGCLLAGAAVSDGGSGYAATCLSVDRTLFYSRTAGKLSTGPGLLNPAGLIPQTPDVLFTLSLCDSFFEHAFAPKLASRSTVRQIRFPLARPEDSYSNSSVSLGSSRFHAISARLLKII